jgi:phosphoglycerate dehydrogenase-like enzyme
MRKAGSAPRGALVVLVQALASTGAPAAGPDAATQALMREVALEESPQPLRETSWWTPPKRIHLTAPPSHLRQLPDLVRRIEEVTGGVEIISLPLEHGAAPEAEVLREAEVFVGWCSAAAVERGVNLKLYQAIDAGVEDCVMSPAIGGRSFVLANTQKISGPSAAEHAIALTLALSRKLPAFHEAQLEGAFSRELSRDPPMVELGGKTMLVAGLGGIGTEVARLAAAIGMRVIATRASSREGPDFVDYVGLANELPELAARADVIVNALPYTDETRGLFDRRLFDRMKPGSYYVSVGRGETTVTGDLVAALEAGKLAGAGLDVTDPEPLPPDHRLWRTANVIITPHVASSSRERFERQWLVIRENLRRYVGGERLLNVVDIERGY